MAVELAPELLEILACPSCHGALAVDHDRDELVCTATECGLAYPVRRGIPVLLIDEARRPDAPLGSTSAAGPHAGTPGSGTPGSGTPASGTPVDGSVTDAESH